MVYRIKTEQKFTEQKTEYIMLENYESGLTVVFTVKVHILHM